MTIPEFIREHCTFWDLFRCLVLGCKRATGIGGEARGYCRRCGEELGE